MVKKDKEIVKDVKDSAQKIWLAGLGAFALAEEEGGKLFDKLVKRGEGLESKGREEMDKVIKNLAAMRGRAEGTFGKVERKLDEQVAVVLAGEISLGAAISSLDWVSSHEKYGRNR